MSVSKRRRPADLDGLDISLSGACGCTTGVPAREDPAAFYDPMTTAAEHYSDLVREDGNSRLLHSLHAAVRRSTDG